MTLEEIKTLMASTGMPSAYYSRPEKAAPALPYILFYLPNSENFGADDRVYARIETLNVELYTVHKDPEAEAAVEAVLNDAGIFWDKTETYINSESMYEVLYEMEVLINDSNSE